MQKTQTVMEYQTQRLHLIIALWQHMRVLMFVCIDTCIECTLLFLVQDPCEGCCIEESSEGFSWPRLAHELESRRSCALLHPMFNEESYVRRRCSDKGKWMPVDVTQCVFKEAARFAVVIVVATVGATKEEIKQQAGNLTNQVGLELHRGILPQTIPPGAKCVTSYAFGCDLGKLIANDFVCNCYVELAHPSLAC